MICLTSKFLKTWFELANRKSNICASTCMESLNVENPSELQQVISHLQARLERESSKLLDKDVEKRGQQI